MLSMLGQNFFLRQSCNSSPPSSISISIPTRRPHHIYADHTTYIPTRPILARTLPPTPTTAYHIWSAAGMQTELATISIPPRPISSSELFLNDPNQDTMSKICTYLHPPCHLTQWHLGRAPRTSRRTQYVTTDRYVPMVMYREVMYHLPLRDVCYAVQGSRLRCSSTAGHHNLPSSTTHSSLKRQHPTSAER